MKAIELDVLIFGGGIAGLWLLDELHRRGYRCLLLECRALGAGQTIASQGILHGGLKYSLGGLLDPSSKAVADMPARWRAWLRGDIPPNLQSVRVLSPCCYLWRTASLASRAGLMAAQAVVRTPVEKVPTADRPLSLVDCPGDLLRVDEQVIDPTALLEAFRTLHLERLLQFSRARFEHNCVCASFDQAGDEIIFQARTVVFAAGEGNSGLREQAALAGTAMQTRPLHMVMVRGDLPMLFGHCIDGNKTRVTITSNTDTEHRTIWLVGGQVAERGAEFDRQRLVDFARSELREVLPGVNFGGTQWATYRINRAEGRSPDNHRPEGVTWRKEGAFITAWPTKLVLAPRLAEEVGASLPPPVNLPQPSLPQLPRPLVARPPWETEQQWT